MMLENLRLLSYIMCRMLVFHTNDMKRTGYHVLFFSCYGIIYDRGGLTKLDMENIHACALIIHTFNFVYIYISYVDLIFYSGIIAHL